MATRYVEEHVTLSAPVAVPPAPLSVPDEFAARRETLGRRLPEAEIRAYEPLIEQILRRKRERNAVILAHNYQTPEIFHGVADIQGDSLGLARDGARTDADVIVMAGVHFMAETAKLLSPDKTVLIPDLEAGCSLASSITAADVERLRDEHPGVPVVTYVNTSASVKAASDICCTSSNAVEVVESLGTERVIFLPDEHLGRYVARQTDVDVIVWAGACEVHERFTGAEVRDARASWPGVEVMAHPECPTDVLDEADYVGSTSGMIAHVGASDARRVAMITECSMADNVAFAHPDVEFVAPCNLCPHMKRISLEKILAALDRLEPTVEISEDVAEPARRAVERMLAVGRGAGG